MGFLDQMKGWFSKESAEASDVMDGVKERVGLDLAARERDLKATPDQKMDAIQDEIDSSSAFDDIAAKIDATTAKADANADLAEVENAETSTEIGTDADEDATTTDPTDPEK